MQDHLELVRQNLQSKLKELAINRGLRDSIRIHQVADPIDMTQQAAAREMEIQKFDREAVLARQVRSAVERIEQGSYGICLECEEAISPKRLKAVEWAELCIHCQEKADRSADTRRTDFDSERAWAA